MTDKHHLSVLHPHRDAPSDITYQGRIEASNCPWCRWFESDEGYSGVTSCLHPLQRHKTRDAMSNYTGRHDDWNRHGDCERYELTRFTRFLRLLSFRKPAWRDPT